MRFHYIDAQLIERLRPKTKKIPKRGIFFILVSSFTFQN